VVGSAGARVPFVTKLMFGIGKSADSIHNFGYGTLLLLYYNQVMGLEGWRAGLALAVSLAFDAITDPAMGSWSDGIRSRWGRRHPFMVLGAVPLGLCFFGLFMPPEGLDQTGLFLWLTAFSILTRSALTVYHVPYLSLGAELTSDYRERTTIVAYRTFFGLAGTLLIIQLAWGVFFKGTAENPAPHLGRDAYFPFALAAGGLMATLVLVSAFGTSSAIPHLSGTRQSPLRFSLLRVFTELRQALGSVSFRALFLGTLLFYIYAGVHGALATHLKVFFWSLDTTEIRNWQLAAAIGAVAGLPFVRMANQWLDKRNTVILGVTVGAFASTGPVALQLAEWLPMSREALIVALYVASFVAAMAGILAAVSVGSMMADIADEHELKHGRRQEGIYFGSLAFAGKATTATGNLIAGVGLSIIGFPSNAAAQGGVTAAVLWNFGLLYVVVLVLLVFSTWVFVKYDLTAKRHAEIAAALGRAPLREPLSSSSPAQTSAAVSR